LSYRIEYTTAADEHLNKLTARQEATVLETVTTQLLHQPTVQTKNRKLLRQNRLAKWELRIGAIRVYYDVIEGPEPVVLIRAVGLKVRNRVYVGGEEIQL
jgi:mRNA-degrading endonuclease RelE of RelBE toxin-antitoxin system